MKRLWDEWWPLLGAAVLMGSMLALLIASGGR